MRLVTRSEKVFIEDVTHVVESGQGRHHGIEEEMFASDGWDEQV